MIMVSSRLLNNQRKSVSIQDVSGTVAANNVNVCVCVCACACLCARARACTCVHACVLFQASRVCV